MADMLDRTVTEALRAWRVQHAAGIGVAVALRTAGPVCSTLLARRCFEEAAQLADGGEGIERLVEAMAPILSGSERAVLIAGWSGGRIEAVMDAVISQRTLWENARRTVRAKMVLPAAILVLAAFIAPLPKFILGGDMLEYLLSAFVPLLVGVVIWKLVVRALSHSRGAGRAADGSPAPPSALDNLKLSLPIMRNVEQSRNIAEFATYLANLIDAGVPIVAALETCSQTLANGHYRLAAANSARRIRSGTNLSTSLQPPSLWPMDFVSAVSIGETSGALDDVLRRLADSYRDRYVRAVGALAEWLPRLLYALVALFIIYNIFMLAGAAFSQMNALQ